MSLQDEVVLFLKEMKNLHFFNSAIVPNALLGASRGELTSILIVEGKRNLNRAELDFGDKIRKAHGLIFVVRSLQDAHELAKLEGWHD